MSLSLPITPLPLQSRGSPQLYRSTAARQLFVDTQSSIAARLIYTGITREGEEGRGEDAGKLESLWRGKMERG